MDSDRFTKIQRALAEPKRMEILESIRRLSGGEGVTCNDCLGEMKISQSTFSHHIGELTEAELICGSKEGRFFKLSVNEPVIDEYLAELRKKLLGAS